MPLWYTLECSKHSDGNSLELANKFYETGHFEFAQPNFIGAASTAHGSPSDDYWTYQWNLYNYGLHQGTVGVDINVLDAWDITYGDNNITIAVFDQGIEKDHPDLTSFSQYSYNADTRSSPNQITSNHGISVAGIIAAKIDNDTGIAGIAPNTLIMDVRQSLTGSTLQDEKDLKAGFEYAVNNVCEVG